MEMIVAMNYTQEGGRTISALYSYPFEASERADLIHWLGENNDEVYSINLDQNHKQFIDGIVLEGCRIV